MSALTIGAAARRAGVGVETIRFYERRGLIKQPPRPNGSGFRVYPEDAVKRVRFIQQAQQIGFSLREIKELLSLRADPKADCSDVRERAVIKLEEVQRKIERLREIGEALKALIAACPGRGALGACSILDALVDRPEPAIALNKSNQRPSRRAAMSAVERARARSVPNPKRRSAK